MSGHEDPSFRIESSAQNYTQIYNHYANIQGELIINYYDSRDLQDCFCEQKHIWRPATTQYGAML